MKGIANIDNIALSSKVYNLFGDDPDMDEIFSPLYDDSDINNFIHEQFLEDADTYLEKYSASDYWRGLIQDACSRIDLVKSNYYDILDIGSGGGNTIFPMLEMFPKSSIIASDLSLPLLIHLKKHQISHYPEHTCHVLQMNAEKMIFEPNQFDLVVGGAILHHLFDPSLVIEEVSKVLKPGGHAIFFEPFENGNQIIAMMMKQLILLNEHNEEKIEKDVLDFFKRLIYDFQVRKGDDKADDLFRKIDDKWLFTKEYFVNLAEQLNFSKTTIYPVIDTVNMFCVQFTTYLRLGIGYDYLQLPLWARYLVSEMDDHFSEECKKDMLIEGVLIYSK